jgi:hypothetical protein
LRRGSPCRTAGHALLCFASVALSVLTAFSHDVQTGLPNRSVSAWMSPSSPLDSAEGNPSTTTASIASRIDGTRLSGPSALHFDGIPDRLFVLSTQLTSLQSSCDLSRGVTGSALRAHSSSSLSRICDYFQAEQAIDQGRLYDGIDNENHLFRSEDMTFAEKKLGKLIHLPVQKVDNRFWRRKSKLLADKSVKKRRSPSSTSRSAHTLPSHLSRASTFPTCPLSPMPLL